MTAADTSGQAAIGGTAPRFRRTFARIDPQRVFDLAMRLDVAERSALRLIADIVFDRASPLIPNSYTVGLSRNTTLPQRPPVRRRVPCRDR